MIGPLLIGALVTFATLRKPEERKEMSGKLRHTLQMALSSSKLTAAQYRELAEAFDQGGWTVEAALLRKRAVLRELPEDLRKKRADLFRKGLGSLDPEAVEELAAAFEEEGATGSAKTLREHAIAIRHAKEVPPLVRETDYEADVEMELGFPMHAGARAMETASVTHAHDSATRASSAAEVESASLGAKSNGAAHPDPAVTPFDASHPDPTIANP